MADRCAAKGVRIVLYPHSDTTFVCIEEALAIYRQLSALGHPEVRLSIHLCHEQSAGRMAQITTISAAAAPYLVLASINGSSGYGDIRPLDQGTYDPTPFLQALAAVGFAGPMTLHTYNLRDPRLDNHLVRSRLRWEQLVTQPAP
jgi:sugar phosphate isomerase/epimerase